MGDPERVRVGWSNGPSENAFQAALFCSLAPAALHPGGLCCTDPDAVLSRPLRPVSALRAGLCAILLASGAASAQTVPVGQGGYSLTRPSGEVGPQNAAGQSIAPKVSADFAQPAQSNDWWSSLLYPFFGDAFSNNLYAHPVNARAASGGLQIGATNDPLFVANDHLYPFRKDLTVGASGLSASRGATVSAYGDWTVTARWEGAPLAFEATLGHGLPFVFFRLSADAIVTPEANATVWSRQGGVLGLTVGGNHYGVFAPTGATWTGTGPFRSTLDARGYLSVALLPDASPATLEIFRQHAYAFVTDSRVEWDYDESASRVTSTYSYETEAMETGADLSDQTLTALYRHQWLDSPTPQTGHTYRSPRGEMRLVRGSTFTTERAFTGVLPSLPNQGDLNPAELLSLVRQAAQETIPPGGTYENGKEMGRFAQLVHIADQIGATAERDHFLAELKRQLEAWFTVGGRETYVYDETWDALTGYPSGYGADNQLNDHHFHASYAIRSAATVAQFDPAWAAPEAWGGMVNLLIRNANGWDREDEMFPFLRTFDPYAGHSWAAGHGDFAEGNNQESSSESMNFASATLLWGEATGQTEIRDLGVYLHTTEAAAVDQYWFDVDEEVFPAGYPHVAIGMVWGGKGVHSTWFGADPEFIHGINILPITSGSLYLGRDPGYVVANYDEIVRERNGPPVIWKDVLWEYLALGDPTRALAAYYADPTYEPFDGESRAHTLHWLANLKKMGRVEMGITADVPTYAVFRDAAGDLTYIAHNARGSDRLVTFSDGFSMTVGPLATRTETTSTVDPEAPVARLVADKTTGKAPLAVSFEASRSFDPDGGDLAFAWDFRDGRTSTQADTTVTFTEVGPRWVTLAVADAQGLVSRDSVRIEVLANGTPYGGSPAIVPGVIQAEAYDLGGEGRAYRDADANNIGLAFRPNEGVDIENGPQGPNVYWITAGEWIEWTFEVQQAGTFTVSPSVASVPGFGSFRMLIDNQDVSGVRAVTGTGGWQFWRDIPVENVELSAGVHILRMEFDSQTDPNGWLFSLDFIAFTRESTVGVDDAEPLALALSQSVPNPVRRTARIGYTLARSGPVTLEVFNSLGQTVAVLVDQEQASGEHAVEFDASGLSSGVYFYRLRSAAETVTRSLVRL